MIQRYLLCPGWVTSRAAADLLACAERGEIIALRPRADGDCRLPEARL